MIQLRQKAYCRMLAQFDKTNFALRKRLFEVRYVLDELIWQKQTVGRRLFKSSTTIPRYIVEFYTTVYFLISNSLFYQLEQERDRVMREIEKTKERVNTEINALRLFESQNCHRIYRVNNELCQDKCTDNLQTQVMAAKHRVEHLQSQLDSTKYAGSSTMHYFLTGLG